MPASLFSATTRDRLALVGAVATAAVAAQAARLLWLRAQLSLGPVLVSKWRGEWALVTGASEGLGKAIATALARQGLHVILVSRSQSKLDAAAAEIAATHPGAQVRTIATDLSVSENCHKLLQQLADTRIRVLVANAGGGVGKGLAPFWDYSQAEEDAVTLLNGPSCYILTKGLLPRMTADGGGAVVGISSVMSKWANMAAPYGAEKAKMNALMEAVDAELKITGNHGVTAQAMIIGGVATPATAKMVFPELRTLSPSAAAAALKDRAMPSTFAPADQVGEAVVRAIGRGGPIVTPYWKHFLQSGLLLHSCWPPSLQRALQRKLTQRMLTGLDKRKAAAAAAGAAAQPSS